MVVKKIHSRLMKNAFSLATVAGLLLALSSCKKDEVQVKADMSAAPTLTASKTNAGTLVSANATAPALIYTWTPVTFALSDGSKPVIPVTYTLELAKAGTNFANIATLPAGNNTVRDTVKVADLNTALVKAGITPTVAGTVDVRLRASYSGNQSDLLSGVSQLTAVPYSRDLFFFGTSIGALGSSSPYIREQEGKPAQYEGYIYVPNATNTFRLSNTNTPSGTLFGAGANNTTVMTGSSTDFTLAGPRMYRVSINLTTGALTTVATDWGIVGAATTGDAAGWNQSVPMTYDVAKKVWKLVDQTMPGTSGGNLEFKFRANDAWTINYGESKTKPGISKLEQDGDNLKTSGAGKYDITLDLNDPDKYTYTLTKK
jgi:hypothetical protein